MILRVSFKKPEGADLEDIAGFVHDALTSMGGSRHPEDPMFHSIRDIEWIEVHGRRFVPEEIP